MNINIIYRLFIIQRNFKLVIEIELLRHNLQ